MHVSGPGLLLVLFIFQGLWSWIENQEQHSLKNEFLLYVSLFKKNTSAKMVNQAIQTRVGLLFPGIIFITLKICKTMKK